MDWKLDKSTGYMYGINKNSPYADKYGKIYEHHHVMCENIGRRLLPNECVHHINRDKTDNTLSNLRLMTLSEHSKLHAIEDRGYSSEIRSCRKCSVEFCASTKSRQIYCSMKCSRVDSREFEINPEDLSVLVWAMPTTEVAKILGVSDVAVAKRCKKYGISKPPRGYWAKQYSKK